MFEGETAQISFMHTWERIRLATKQQVAMILDQGLIYA